MEKPNKDNKALETLFWRDEILQVLYWMQGEKLDEWVHINKLKIFLNTNIKNLLYHLEKMVNEKYITPDTPEITENSGFKLAEKGKEEAGMRFSEAFQGMQKQGHGECSPDCDCQWEGHDSCSHQHHHH
jgi:hypothetical protein